MTTRFNFQTATTLNVIASEVIHAVANLQDGLLRRFAPRNDVETQLRDLAAGFRASFG
jgi:hypothetical protein